MNERQMLLTYKEIMKGQNVFQKLIRQITVVTGSRRIVTLIIIHIYVKRPIDTHFKHWHYRRIDGFEGVNN